MHSYLFTAILIFQNMKVCVVIYVLSTVLHGAMTKDGGTCEGLVEMVEFLTLLKTSMGKEALNLCRNFKSRSE